MKKNRYQIVTYFGGCMDDKQEFTSITLAEKYAKKLPKNTQKSGDAGYDGYGIWDRKIKKYVRTWGFFPTEEDVQDGPDWIGNAPNYDKFNASGWTCEEVLVYLNID